jgi:chaperonin GroES
MKPLKNFIQINIEKPDKETKGGLIIPDSQEKRLEKAKVVAVGKEIEQVKKGDTILFKQFSTDTIEVDSKEFSFIKEEDVLAII